MIFVFRKFYLCIAVIALVSLMYLSAGPFTVTKTDNTYKKQSVKELKTACGEHAALVVSESQQLIAGLATVSHRLFEMLCDHVDGAKDGVLAQEKRDPLEKLKNSLENLSKRLQSSGLENDIKEVVRAYDACIQQ